MNTRRLLSSAALYGIADVAVVAVGGFLLLPLYTRTLTQSEFGMYVAIRANIDILTYLLYFGLPSAVARVYFDHKRLQQQYDYLRSVVNFFLIVGLAFGAVLWFWGTALWALLSPTTPAHPYLAFSFAIAAIGFFASIASMWLRMEGRAAAMVSLQLGAALVLATAAVVLLTFGMGLPGVLMALLVSSAVSAAALPLLFGRGFRFAIRWAHIGESLRYAVPILVGYIAYFLLNRFSTLLLQRHVPADQLAVYGLAQQLSLIVAIASTSFGMALQPMVFSAQPHEVTAMLKRSARILLVLVLGITSALILFAAEMVAMVAPQSYSGVHDILLMLLVANFTNAFTLISDTALLYHRRPKTSVAVSITGAAVSLVLCLWLIPLYHLHGAAMSVVGAFIIRMVLSHWLAYRVAGYASVISMGVALATIVLLAVITHGIEMQAPHTMAAAYLKLLLGALTLGAAYFSYRKSRI